MILVDTSVWVAFLRGDERAKKLSGILEDNLVLCHPWIVGELMMGSLGTRRREVIDDLDRLPSAPLIADEEVRAMIEAHRLAGSGIGWVDAQLVGAAIVAGSSLWTLDRRLARVAVEFGIAYG